MPRAAYCNGLLTPSMCLRPCRAAPKQEQQQFSEHFAHWLADLEPDLGGPETGIAAATTDAAAAPLASGPRVTVNGSLEIV